MNECLQNQLNQMIAAHQVHNMQFDFASSDLIIDESVGSMGIFLRYEPIYQSDFKKLRQASFERLPIQRESFFEQYLDFMDTYCSKIRHVRYAVKLTILYPGTIEDIRVRKKFIQQFVTSISGIKDDLPYMVFEYRKGKGLFADIIVIERVYMGKTQYKLYKTDKYIDIRTGRWAGKDCPADRRKRICKKGDYVLDKQGNRIKVTAMFSNSLRIFSYAKDAETKENLFEQFIYRLKQIYINVVLEVLKKVKSVKRGKRLQKTANKPEYHRYTRRRIASINYAKQCIEYITNELLQEESKKDKYYEHFNYARGTTIKHTDKYKQIVGIFMKYKRRFSKKSFHDEDGKERQIDYYDMRVDILDENIEKLLDLFRKDLSSLHLFENPGMEVNT